MDKDEHYMKIALSLAKKGRRTIPNPRVGAVIVKNNEIIGWGYHSVFGGPHAEVVAIQSAKKDITGATMYVTLEPCNHFGKTPPCSERIINEKIGRVVIAASDPNPNVAGGGVARLKQAGVDVKIGVLQAAAEELNRDFNKFTSQKKPYVYLKVAATMDGKIAGSDGSAKWITNEQSRKETHRLRAQVDGILVGINTVLADDPQLNVRYGYKNDNLKKIVLDSKLRLPLDAKILENPRNVIVFYSTDMKNKAETLRSKGVTLIKNDDIKIDGVLRKLYDAGVYRLLVEGGGKVFSSFLREHAADELYWFTGNVLMGRGISAVENIGIDTLDNAIRLHNPRTAVFGDNTLIKGYINVYGNY